MVSICSFYPFEISLAIMWQLNLFLLRKLQLFNAAVSKTSPSACPASTPSSAATTWPVHRSPAATSGPWWAPRPSLSHATHTASPPAPKPALTSPQRRPAAWKTSLTWPVVFCIHPWVGAGRSRFSTSSTPTTSGVWWKTAGPIYFSWARRSREPSWFRHSSWRPSTCSRSTADRNGCIRSTVIRRSFRIGWKNCGRCIWIRQSIAAWRQLYFIQPVRSIWFSTWYEPGINFKMMCFFLEIVSIHPR